MNISMCADFKLYQKNKTTGLFRQMTKDDFDNICPGGFTFEIGDKAVPFDWDAGATSDEDGIFHYESGYGPFFNDFELTDCFDDDYEELGLKREEISAEFLASVTNINEFYISLQLAGEDDDKGIGDNNHPETEFLIELLAISFKDRDTGNSYDVDEKVIEKFNGKIISYNISIKDFCYTD